MIAIAMLTPLACIPHPATTTALRGIDTVSLALVQPGPAFEWSSPEIRYSIAQDVLMQFIDQQLSQEERAYRREYLEYIRSTIERRLTQDSVPSLWPFQHLVVDLIQAGRGSLLQLPEIPLETVVVTSATECVNTQCYHTRTIRTGEGTVLLSVVDSVS
jgi:hypothetical protein